MERRLCWGSAHRGPRATWRDRARLRAELRRTGELDIVARDGSTLVVAEVRLRASKHYGGAAASITRAKRRRIVLATRHLLARYPSMQKMPVRFDCGAEDAARNRAHA